MKLVTAYKAFNSMDAQMMASRLEAAGFHPFVADEYTAANIVGGAVAIRVQVPEAEFAEVRTFIDAPAE